MLGSNIDNLIKDLWENRAIGIAGAPLDAINQTTLAYLRECYPYLQMISMNAKFEETVIPQFKKSSCGWIIHDYGQAMSSSPGRYLYGGNAEVSEEGEGGEGGATGTGFGTLTRQTVDTADAMIQWAIEKGWPGVEIISGTELMRWAVWLAAQDKNYPITGYFPTEEGQKKFDRIQKKKAQMATQEVKPVQTRGG